jgi:hypothetical protein
MIDEDDTPQTPPADATPPPADPPAADPPAESAIEAMRRGVDEATAAEAPKPVETPETPDPKAKPDAKDTKDAKPDGKDGKAPEKPDAEAEITALGLKERSAQRFRELSAEVASHKSALEAAGLKSLDDLPKLAASAKDGADLIDMVRTTGATPDQYGQALDYLRDVNAAAKGDRQAAERAYERMTGEMAALAKMLGKPVPGVHDPLSDHPDLQEAVAAGGEITAKRAEEMAALRAATRLQDHARQQQDQQSQQQAALQAADASIAQLDAHWKSTDPDYAAKRPHLNVMVAEYKRTLPPSQWAEATQRAYATLAGIKAPPPPAQKPPVGAVPIRGNAVTPPLVRDFKDPMEALRAGIAAANG